MNKEDLNQLSQLLKFQITAETREIEHEADARLRRFKDKTLFLIGLIMILGAFFYFGWRVIEYPDDKWSMAITSSIISAFLGYLTGKKSN